MQKNASNRLGTERVGKLIFQLALPATIAQLVNLLYTLVDRIFIGRIEGVGALALTGVGVSIPLIIVVSATAALIGMGGAPYLSINMGKGDLEKAHKVLGNCFAFLSLLSIILTIFFLAFAEPLLLAFGASENTIPFALEYFSVYTIGTIFVLFTLGLNPFITTQGFAKISMLTVTLGAGINLILDPIFIFWLELGVMGAAIATVIAQAVSCTWVLCFLTGKKSIIKLSKKYIKLEKSILFPVLALGSSPFVMQSTESLLAIAFNASLLHYGGDLAVGTMAVLTCVLQLSILPLVGIAQGAQPVISYNFGAGNANRVKSAFSIFLSANSTYSFVFWALVMCMPAIFVKMFTQDPELIEFASHALQIYMFGSIIFGLQLACQMTFVAIGNAKSSLFLAVLRKIFLLIPLIYILPLIFTENPTTAIFMAEPVSDILAVIVTASLFVYQFKKVLKGMRNKEDQI